MGRMKRWLVEGLGAIGTGFTNFASECVRQVHGYLTRLSCGLTSLSISLLPLLWLGLLILLLGFCLCLEVLIGTGVIVARPVSQGGIDYPDGGFASGGPTYPMIGDLAELAARSGSPVVYDRRGNVVFLSQFRYGTGQFGLTPVGNGASQTLTAGTFLTGPYCLKMVTSDVTNEVSTASTRIAIPQSATRLGVETGVSFTDVEVGFAIQITAYITPDQYQFTLIHRTDQDRLYIVSPTGPGILDDNLVLYAGKQAWHRMKLVVDFENKMYVRALLDEDEWDISDYAAAVDTTGEAKRIDARLQGYSRDNTNREIHWDDIIITQNEPLKE